MENFGRKDKAVSLNLKLINSDKELKRGLCVETKGTNLEMNRKCDDSRVALGGRAGQDQTNNQQGQKLCPDSAVVAQEAQSTIVQDASISRPSQHPSVKTLTSREVEASGAKKKQQYIQNKFQMQPQLNSSNFVEQESPFTTEKDRSVREKDQHPGENTRNRWRAVTSVLTERQNRQNTRQLQPFYNGSTVVQHSASLHSSINSLTDSRVRTSLARDKQENELNETQSQPPGLFLTDVEQNALSVTVEGGSISREGLNPSVITRASGRMGTSATRGTHQVQQNKCQKQSFCPGSTTVEYSLSAIVEEVSTSEAGQQLEGINTQTDVRAGISAAEEREQNLMELRCLLSAIIKPKPSNVSVRRPNIREEKQDSMADYCAICFDTTSRKKMKRLPCRHQFHKVCINDWLKRKLTCPICRKSAPAPSFFNKPPTRQGVIHRQIRTTDDQQSWLTLPAVTPVFGNQRVTHQQFGIMNGGSLPRVDMFSSDVQAPSRSENRSHQQLRIRNDEGWSSAAAITTFVQSFPWSLLPMLVAMFNFFGYTIELY